MCREITGFKGLEGTPVLRGSASKQKVLEREKK